MLTFKIERLSTIHDLNNRMYLKTMLDMLKPAVPVVLEGFTQLRPPLLLSFH